MKGLLLFICAVVAGAQNNQTASSDPMVIRAAEIRRQIVEQFGNEADIAAFNNPGKREKGAFFPTEPENVFIRVYARQGLFNLGGSRAIQTTYSPNRVSLKHDFLEVLRQMFSINPGLDQVLSMIVKEDDPSSRKDADAKDAIAQGGLIFGHALVTIILGQEAGDRYKSADYLDKVGAMFKAGVTLIDSQAVPSPFVVYLCDTYSSTTGGRGSGARESLSNLRPTDARFDEKVWETYSKPQQYVNVTNGLRDFMSDAAAAMSDPTKAIAFVRGLDLPINKDQTKEDRILESYGKEGIKTYQAALRDNPARAKQMEDAASVIILAPSLLSGLIIGDQKPGFTFPSNKQK